MKFYKKRSPIVHAVQVTEKWFSREFIIPTKLHGYVIHDLKNKKVVAMTLEGDVTVPIGSWIILELLRGVCVRGNDMFEKNYEETPNKNVSTCNMCNGKGQIGCYVCHECGGGGYVY